MKKVFITVEERTVYVWIDDETAAVLSKVPEDIRNQYLIEEYKSLLTERRETRRHQSLEASADNGFDLVDDSPSPEDATIDAEMKKALFEALETLNGKQKWLVNELYFEKKKQRDIAKELGISEAALCQQITLILGKLKKFLRNFEILP